MIMLNLLMAQQKVAQYIFCGVRIDSEKKYQSVDYRPYCQRFLDLQGEWKTVLEMLSLLADLSHYLQLKQSRQDYYFSHCSTTTFITFLLGHAKMKASCTKEYVQLKQHVY